MIKNKGIAFLRTSSRPIPRILRMMGVGVEAKLEPYFIGAFRHEGLPSNDRWSGFEVKRVGKYFPLANGRGLISYLLGIFWFNIDCYRALKKDKPIIVHSSDFESFLCGWLYCVMSGSFFIYNIHDNLSQRYPLPWFFRWLLNLIEGAFVLGSDISLVPEDFRRSSLPWFCRRKVKVIKNTPADIGAGFDPLHMDESGVVSVFFAGWIEKGRGVDSLIALSRLPWIEIKVAGDGDDELVDKLASHGQIKYLGYLNHDQIMSETKRSHFVFALYDPVRVINRYAAPNKVAEALSCGRPVIINSEVVISKSIQSGNCGLVVGYDDISSMVEGLEQIRKSPDNYQLLCRNARELFEREYAWDIAKAKTVEIYEMALRSR